MRIDGTRMTIAAAGILALGAAGAAGWMALSGGADDMRFSAGTIDARDSGIGGVGDVVLTAHDGEETALDALVDGPTLVYFGYTFCPDVCPFDAQDMAAAVDLLAERGIDVDPVFVTVDPERDTPEQLAWFVEAMHPEMVGLAPGADALERLKRDWKLYFQKGETGESADDYLMSHSSFTYFVTPESGVVMMFRSDQSPETMAADIRLWLEATDHPALAPAS